MRALEDIAFDFARLFQRLHRLLDRRMTACGASLARTKLLRFMECQGPVRATDIADALGQAPRTVTDALDGLERDGLIRREPDDRDRRVKQVLLTALGVEAIAETEPLRLKLVEQIFGVLDGQEREQLDAIIGKLSAAVDKAEEEGC